MPVLSDGMTIKLSRERRFSWLSSIS